MMAQTLQMELGSSPHAAAATLERLVGGMQPDALRREHHGFHERGRSSRAEIGRTQEPPRRPDRAGATRETV
jgi:hypothetical protein